jgi:glycosyltransferase involved in cell wall biosynthesis
VVPWKGCHLLVEAFSELYRRKGQNAGTLDIIGGTLYWSESYRAELAASISRQGLQSACRLLPHTETPLEAMAGSDVFCCASDREPFGRAVAEAQGCGLPVIAFAAGGVVEIVAHGETGVLVPAGDIRAFADAMEGFVNAPEKIAAMGRAARDRAFRCFNRSDQIPAIADFLLGSAGGS